MSITHATTAVTADDGSEVGVTAWNEAHVGGLALGSATPLVESGTGTAGTDAAASHEDHVHPGAFDTDTPALTLGTTNSAGVATSAVATDATILAFDATVPVTQALGDSAAVGSAVVAARRDHVHGIWAATHFEIPFLMNTSSGDVTDTTYAIGYQPVYFDKAQFTGYASIHFAADITQNAVGTFMAYCQMYNQTAGNATSMPELSADLAQYGHSNAVSADVSGVIAAGPNLYTYQTKAETGGTTHCNNIRLIVRF